MFMMMMMMMSTNICFMPHIYSRKNKTVKHKSFYVFAKWGKYLRHTKVQYDYDKKMFTGRARPFRIIGDPHNQRPDKLISKRVKVK